MEIDRLREKVDEINFEILELLAKRMDIVRKIGDYKEENNLDIEDEDREIEMYEKLREKGEELGLSNDFVKALFKKIVDESKKEQE